MKQIILLLLLMANVAAYAQRKPKIKGNRNVIEVKEDLPPFNAIVLDDDLEVVLKSNRGHGYELEADDNIADVLRFTVENETLKITSFYKVTRKKRLNITVFFDQLNQITVNDGKILAKDTFSTDALTVDIRGGAKAELAIKAQVLDIFMEGNSNGDFKMEGDSLNLDLKDKAKIKLYAVTETTKIDLAKNSDAYLEGLSANLHCNLMESASLKASKLEVGTMVASLDASASAEVHITGTLELFASGSSKTYVYGDGKIDLQEFLDNSELYRRKK